MNKSELKHKYITRDRVVRALSLDGKIRAVAVKNTNSALAAQINHELPPLPALLLAKHLAAATLISAFLKGEERIILETESDGDIYRLYSEAIQVGEVRGYARWREIPDILNKYTDLDYLGNGIFKVQKILYNQTEPATSIIPIQSGNIESELVYYFMMSEQIPTITMLDSVLNENGTIAHSGGLLVQALPGANQSEFADIYTSLQNASRITSYLASALSPEDILRELLPFQFDVVKSTQVDFFCRCSKSRFIEKLMTLNHKEIQDMQNEGTNELVCHYCNKKYEITKSDFENLIGALKAKSN